LVGTKSDQLFIENRSESELQHNLTEVDRAAQIMVNEGLVNFFFKTSSLLGCNVKNVFDQAIMSVITQRKGE